MELKFRLLKPEEIDVRVGATDKSKKAWITLLLYKNARVDMDILDDTVGKMNWKRKHLNNNANCVVSIYDENKNEWVEKEDTGTESNTEAEKGLASDSFKRACVNWGIGRELYSAPQIFVKGNADVLKYGKYRVSSISYDANNKIDGLVIVNKSNEVVFEKKPSNITQKQVGKLQSLLKPLGEDYKKALYGKLGITSSKELSFDSAKDLIKKLEEKNKKKLGDSSSTTKDVKGE